MQTEETAARSPLKLAVIVASTREKRLAPTIAAWTLAQVRRRSDYRLDVIDLAETPLPASMPDADPPEVLEFRARIAAADAFLVITPEYNHSFPGPLKIAIDSAYSEWRAKAVALVSYGGIAGGLRAVEHLRHVFAELQVMSVRNTVSFHDVWNEFDDEGQPRDAAVKERGATQMLDQLAWWGRALRQARRVEDYPRG